MTSSMIEAMLPTKGRCCMRPTTLALTGLLISAGALPAADQPDPATDWKRSNPDIVVYLPKGGDHHDTDNEHFLVFPSPKGSGLLALWTQSSVEGKGDNRAMLARSADGRIWSEPQRVRGTTHKR